MQSEGLSFVGCRVDKSDLYVARISYPAPLQFPVFLIEALGPCDGLLVNAVRVGNSENLLAVDTVPAALFEQPPIVPLIFPSLTPDVQLVVQFQNEADEPALFVLWLGSEMAIRLKFQQLLAQKAAKRS